MVPSLCLDFRHGSPTVSISLLCDTSLTIFAATCLLHRCEVGRLVFSSAPGTAAEEDVEDAIDAIRFEFLFSAATSACVSELCSALLLFPKAVAAVIAVVAIFATLSCSSLIVGRVTTTGTGRLSSVISLILLARDALPIS